MAVPADDGLRLHQDENRVPVGPDPGEPDPEDAVTGTEPRPLRRALEDGELVAKGEVFGGQGCSLDHQRLDEREQELEGGEVSARVNESAAIGG
jgi:hypothetical protein